jgi:hypothetical protein
MDLPRHLPLDRSRLPGVSTPAWPSESQGNDFIGMRRHLQGVADMTTLSAGRPAGLLALTLGCPGLVGARWLTGCPAVLSQSGLQSMQTSKHLSQLGFQACAVGAGTLADALLYSIRRVLSPC